jgi:transposase
VPRGIIVIHRNGLRRRDAPAAYRSRKTLCNRWKRWSDKGIFAQMNADMAAGHGISACIPGRKQRETAIRYDKRRNRIEIMSGRLQDWRRLATRHVRCPRALLSAIALAALVIC